MKLEKIRLRCIKRFLNEDDLFEFEHGQISLEDIRVTEVGTEVIGKEGFDTEYFEEIKSVYTSDDCFKAVNNWSMVDVPLSEIEKFLNTIN